ncbi:MAG: hypothetical protein ACR2HP_16415 [Ilumatobacteraceae bacterium]
MALTACGDSAGDGGGAAPEPVPAGTESAAATAGSAATGSAADGQQFPNIVEATATSSGRTWTFEVTVSSPYDTPERYADGWRVLGPDGTVYGEHELTHDHAGEQPFTRTEDGVEIPEGVTEVTIEGRDLVNGYGGQTAVVQLAAS